MTQTQALLASLVLEVPLVLGVAACVLAGEAAVRDFERVDEERGGEKTE